jgi:hypothetical protein
MNTNEAERKIFLNIIVNTLGECYKAIGINRHYEINIKPALLISFKNVALEHIKDEIASFFQVPEVYDTGTICPKFLMDAIENFPINSIDYSSINEENSHIENRNNVIINGQDLEWEWDYPA